jgi:hypothetical protein
MLLFLAVAFNFFILGAGLASPKRERKPGEKEPPDDFIPCC